MSLTFTILGTPGQDNALLVRIDSGKKIARLLFDCGSDCLSSIETNDQLRISDRLITDGIKPRHLEGELPRPRQSSPAESTFLKQPLCPDTTERIHAAVNLK